MFLVDQAGFIGPRPLPLRREKGVVEELVALPYLLGTTEHHRKGQPGPGPSIPARDRSPHRQTGPPTQLAYIKVWEGRIFPATGPVLCRNPPDRWGSQRASCNQRDANCRDKGPTHATAISYGSGECLHVTFLYSGGSISL